MGFGFWGRFMRRRIRHVLQIAADYVGGADLLGNPGHDFEESLTAVEVGIRVRMAIAARLHISGSYQNYIPLFNENSRHTARNAFGIGLIYLF